LYDAIEGNSYTVSGGAVTVPVHSSWGVVLLEQRKIEQPAPVASLTVTVNGADKELSWPAGTADTNGGTEVTTAYHVYAGPAGFTPGAGNLLATVSPPTYGSANQMISYTHVNGASSGLHYALCAENGAGVVSTCARFTPTAVTLSNLSATTTTPATAVWGWLFLLLGVAAVAGWKIKD
jgi:hypothetical protein